MKAKSLIGEGVVILLAMIDVDQSFLAAHSTASGSFYTLIYCLMTWNCPPQGGHCGLECLLHFRVL